MSTETYTPIQVDFPQAENLNLRISVGACKLTVKPGQEGAWVGGAYTDPYTSLPLKLEQEGGTLRISQEYSRGEWWNLAGGRPPRLDLILGTTHPYSLTIESGASECELELGGLPITRLAIKTGAGKLEIDFSQPNPQLMSLLDVDAGAVSLELDGLGNANFAEMALRGGAASYELEFDGEARQDQVVRITTGMAAVSIKIPHTRAARISTETIMASLSVGDGFMKKDGSFWSEAALAGKTPLLTIHANLSLGSLAFRTS